jgi:hypothetical protein
VEEPVFADKSKLPSDAQLAKTLGRAKRYWDAFRAQALAAIPGGEAEWKCHAGLSGWTLVLRCKRRNLAYLRPLAKHFSVSFAFGAAAVAAAEQSDLPAPVIEMIRAAPQYPEGRAVRVDVKTAADAEVVQKLLVIKAEN